MATLHYATLRAIRAEAGLQNRSVGRAVTGATDGSNKTFYVNDTPIVDANDDDSVTAEDVIFYVNDIAVDVADVDARTGKIVLVSAPANGASVSADYYWSPVDDYEVFRVRKAAESWLNRRVKKSFDLTTITSAASIPAEWNTVVELWAAARLVIRDYGSGVDTDESSKDGYKKLGQAKALLQEWIDDIAGDSEDGGKDAQMPSTSSDGNIFSRVTDLSADSDCSTDREFFNKDC